MSEEPVCPAKRPCVLKEEAGTVRLWCACGRSASQPFCDGSHAGTSFQPLEFVVPESRRFAWCACKRSGNPPYCDGTHNRI